MKINPKILFETSGLSCIKIIPGEDGAVAGRHRARAVFVTDETVRLAREADPGARHDDPHCPDVRYGDLLVRWVDDRGVRAGMRAPAGMDAGVHLEIRDGPALREIPVSGIAMLSARDALAGLAPLTEDHRRVLSGIDGVFRAILADPDIERFSGEMIGMAFLSRMTAPGERMGLSVRMDGFGRKARADLLRSRIAMIDPKHPDSARKADSLQEIIAHALPIPVLPSSRLSGAALADEGTLRRMIGTDPDLLASVFRELTTVPDSEISALAVVPEQIRDLLDGLAHHRLSGEWIDGIEDNLRRISLAREAGDEPGIDFFALRGRDVMVVSDRSGDEATPAYVFSWPSHRRALTQSGVARVNISREETPSEAEIARLGEVLGELTRDAEHDRGLDFLESVDRAGRG